VTATTQDGPVFSRGAVIAWARGIGIPDEIALEFMRQEGVVVTPARVDERGDHVGRPAL